jgi:hypothetical protein
MRVLLIKLNLKKIKYAIEKILASGADKFVRLQPVGGPGSIGN